MRSSQSTRFSPLLNTLAAAILMLATTAGARAAGEFYGSANAGATVTLTVTADGNPAPMFQWVKAGVAIPGATSNTLVLSKVTTADSAVYNAIATNTAGWSLSNDLILTVNATANVAPTITLQPFPNAIAGFGSALTLSVEASGVPAPIYQWTKNGVPISGATNSTLSFLSLTGVDSGVYAATATNVAGTATSNNSVVTVTTTTTSNIAPAITQQPVANQISAWGSAFSFTVAASGNPAPTYQWTKNDVAISGATNAVLSFPSLTTNDSGVYQVIVSNIAGSVTSNKSTLTVASTTSGGTTTGGTGTTGASTTETSTSGTTPSETVPSGQATDTIDVAPVTTTTTTTHRSPRR